MRAVYNQLTQLSTVHTHTQILAAGPIAAQQLCPIVSAAVMHYESRSHLVHTIRQNCTANCEYTTQEENHQCERLLVRLYSAARRVIS